MSSDLTVQIPNSCPLCGTSAQYLRFETSDVYGNTTGIDRAFFHCGVCDVFFQWPRLSDAEESDFYRLEFEKFMAGRNADGGFDWTGSEAHIRTNQEQRKRREVYLTPYYQDISSSPGGELLEIGCSSGFMLYGLQEIYGINCFGIEPSGVFSSFVEGRGIPVSENMERLRVRFPGKRFDLIMHFFVLEHIKSPEKFIAAAIELLKPGGRLVIEIPNGDDALRTLYPTPAFGRFYWSIAHPWYFTEKSLNYLLGAKCGLTSYAIFRDQRYDIGNHVRWLSAGRPGGQHSLSHIFDGSFDAVFKQALIRAGNCDTLIAIITKPN